MKREDCIHYETKRCVNYEDKIECKDCQDYIPIGEQPTKKELEEIKREEGKNPRKFEMPELTDAEIEGHVEGG